MALLIRNPVQDYSGATGPNAESGTHSGGWAKLDGHPDYDPSRPTPKMRDSVTVPPHLLGVNHISKLRPDAGRVIGGLPGMTIDGGALGGGGAAPRGGLNPALTGFRGASYASPGAAGVTQYGLFSRAGGAPSNGGPPGAFSPGGLVPGTVGGTFTGGGAQPGVNGGTFTTGGMKTNLPMPSSAPTTSIPTKGGNEQSAPINYKGGLNPFAPAPMLATAPSGTGSAATGGGGLQSPAPRTSPLNPLVGSYAPSTSGLSSSRLGGGGGGGTLAFSRGSGR